MRKTPIGSTRRRALRRKGSVELLESRLLLTVGPNVVGRANIFGAGLIIPPGEWPGVLPPSIPIPAGTNFIEFPSVTGAVSFDNDQPGTRPFFGPDGGAFGPFGAPGLTDINSSGSISGIVHSTHAFLAGVFLTDAAPTGVAPNRLNFSDSSSFLTIAPELHQTFFVGDGRTETGNGILQRFIVPSGATRLFFGFADGLNPQNNTIAGDRNYYHDNGGAFDVQYQTVSIVAGTTGDDLFEVTGDGVFLNGVKIIVAGKVILEGRSGNDTYRFDADSWVGRYSIDESGGGIDTIDFASTTAAVRSALDAVEPQIVNQNLTLQLDSGVTIENLVGGNGNDWLSGNSLDNSIKGNTGNDELFGRSGNDVVAGGPGNDLYEFGSAIVAEADRVIELTNQGTDTLSFTSLASPVTLSMSSVSIQNVNSLRTLVLNSGSTFENAIGGAGADRLSGNSRDNSLVGGDGDDSLSGLAGSDVLRGGKGDDVYKYFTATTPEVEAIIEYANEGTDTLDLSVLTEVITMDLSSTLSQAVSLNRTIKLNSGATMENIIGGSGGDFLTGNGRNNALNGGKGSDTLAGKTGDDSYVFLPATSLETDTLIEVENAGRDSLDFYEISDNITLNLGAATTQLAHRNRRLQLSNAVAFENVFGGKGNDSLTGNAAFNILVGNTGNDRLSGLGGRDVVIGGLGLDSLVGGDGDDILIAGRTVYDRNIGNLLSIESQWNSGEFYAVRVASLLSGIGTSGVSLKPRTTVFNDSGDDDTGNGGSGTDWYFRALDDVISGLLFSETISVL